MPERKGPSESATKFKIGQRKKGLDGNMWEIIKTKNGVKRWKKVTHAKGHKAPKASKDSKASEATLPTMKHKGKTYLIHDNGGRPFLVTLPSKQQVQIYKLPKLKEGDYIKINNDKKYYTVPVKQYKVTKTFVGKSPLNTMTRFSRGHGPKFDGNSILLHLTKDRYVYIGSVIYEFDFPENIIKYTSPIGNNDVPYPVAFSANSALFMLDKAYLPKADFPSGTDWSDAYDAFYEATYGSYQKPIDKKSALKPKKLPKMKQVHKRI